MKKIILIASLAIFAISMTSCGGNASSNATNSNADTTKKAEPTTQTETPQQQEIVVEKNTNKPFMCPACKEYFDNEGVCEKCGMDLVENVDYKAE
ncbi:MAG: hypothetical protein MJ211_06265 [Bacteroidales bacterium]|nr:hypothetical protein [Bacteroidales bacterium]